MAGVKFTNISPTLCLLILSSCLVFSHSKSQSPVVQAQDILRTNRQQQQPPSSQRPQMSVNPLDNIQLPPQLASLTPQQLHHLAQLREMQLQQQAQQQQQQQQQASSAPPPLGLEQLPTAQPTGSNNAQIPQPMVANSAVETNDRHDDGSYNEAGSEMEGVVPADVGANGNNQAPSSTGGGSDSSPTSGSQPAAASNGNQAAQPQAAAAPTFEVNWNKCPQLEPSESEKNKKTQVITKCLQSAPIPTNLTRESVETHREQIATCALKVEGWFDDRGDYKYDKAESEIRAKKLQPVIENQVLKFHIACKDEASKKFPRDQNKLIDQVQFYQACMDYYISIVCEIEVSVDQ